MNMTSAQLYIILSSSMILNLLSLLAIPTIIESMILIITINTEYPQSHVYRQQ
jgi:hypothetical protein